MHTIPMGVYCNFSSSLELHTQSQRGIYSTTTGLNGMQRLYRMIQTSLACLRSKSFLSKAHPISAKQRYPGPPKPSESESPEMNSFYLLEQAPRWFRHIWKLRTRHKTYSVSVQIRLSRCNLRLKETVTARSAGQWFGPALGRNPQALWRKGG